MTAVRIEEQNLDYETLEAKEK